MSNHNHGDYKQIAKDARLKVLDMVYKAKSSHIGSNFSVIDILTVLFEKHDKVNDKIILSAGWKAAAFYYFLAKRGDFPMEWLDTYNQEGSKLIGLTEPGVPGVLFAGGSMQMGLPAAVGFALSMKLKNKPGKVYCILSDGELAGGMIWESICIAKQHKLNNLFIMVDVNGLQAMGPTEKILDVLSIFPDFPQVNGHDFKSIENSLNKGNKHDAIKLALYKTVKGKGWKRAENNNLYHYKDLSYDEYNEARQEILQENELQTM